MVDESSSFLFNGLNAPVFQYEKPLEENKAEIRILTLQPGLFEEPLITNLRMVSLHSDPNFEALSYVWGNGSETKNISINGAVKRITVNLESTLRHLRLVDKPRDIWVDAICIDQAKNKENEEKRWQLPLMAVIYQKSTTTVLWFGEASKELESLFRHMEAIPGSLKFNDIEKLTKRNLNEHETNIVRNLIKIKFCAIAAFECSWWSRSWTLQEVVLPESDPIIVCGKNKTTWSQFWLCADLAFLYWERMAWTEWPTGLGEEVHRLCSGSRAKGHAFQNNPDKRKELRRIWHKLPVTQKGLEPLTLLQITKYLSATDPRDKVYCLLGLFTKDFSKSISVDYTVHPMKLFEDVARRCWLSGSISELCSFEFESESSPLLEDSFPSWVPDFSHTKTTLGRVGWEKVLGLNNVRYITSHTDANISQRSGLIKVRASPIDTIYENPSINTSRKERMIEKIRGIREYYRDVVKKLRTTGLLLIEQNFAKFFMTADCSSALTKLLAVPPEWRPKVKELVHLFLDHGIENGQNFKQYCIEHCPPIDTTLLGTYIHTSIERQYTHIWKDASFLVGRRGFFIGGPNHTRSGDLVVVISGMTCPIILRRKENDLFRVIGPAYVYELMDGDVINLLKEKGLYEDTYILC